MIVYSGVHSTLTLTNIKQSRPSENGNLIQFGIYFLIIVVILVTIYPKYMNYHTFTKIEHPYIASILIAYRVSLTSTDF